MTIQIGDKVVCIESGVKGIVVKQYYPTACEEQTMIKTDDGRLYHAPTHTFFKDLTVIVKELKIKGVKDDNTRKN